MTEKRFSLEKDYDRDGSWEYCYQDNETGRRFNFADDNCDTDFLELVNAVIDDLKKENKELKSILQDIGLIMSNEEVKNVRDEIASKLIKTLKNCLIELDKVKQKVKKEKTISDYGLKACENCCWYIDNDFCSKHFCYTCGAYYCLKWEKKIQNLENN